MCGIAGVYGKVENEFLMDSMLRRITHRGPDDTGFYVSADASFAHARLSIIDIDGGSQPILNESGNVCIVFNGEIYNHKKLRYELREQHTFATNTDTEVILHLYEEVGEQCVEMLDGMFSFAIYDTEKGMLLARDPLGIKPLYTSTVEDTIYFASEMKALIDIVPDFEEFPAGHYYQSQSGLHRYFSVAVGSPEVPTVEKAINGIRYYLKQAVKKRLMSDVPLGVFLSGGLDSSIIAAIAAKYVSGLKTFSTGVEGSEDLKYARLCAESLGTTHYEYTYTIDEILRALPQVIFYLESYDAALVRSAIPNYFVAREASKYVKVVLAGEGADEVFSGYHYLKDLEQGAINEELVQITEALHNTNLQRCDRMSMAHGIEARVPFLDVDMVRFAFTIPIDLKLGPDCTEKWILRQAYRTDLPDELVFRRKSKFSEGCGSSNALAMVADQEISDAEFERNADLSCGRRLRNKEELMYYRIFSSFYPGESAHAAIGFSRSL